jgi:hypothetical protein
MVHLAMPKHNSPATVKPPGRPEPTSDGERPEPALSTAGRRIRLGTTLMGAVLLLAGTIWGSDDHFPFGPFRMYAGVNAPDDDAPDTRVEAVDAAGATVLLTERNTGIRRAEIEGHEAAFVADPTQLDSIATAYERRHPDSARLTRVSLVIRWHDIENGQITGGWHDEVKASLERSR